MAKGPQKMVVLTIRHVFLEKLIYYFVQLLGPGSALLYLPLSFAYQMLTSVSLMVIVFLARSAAVTRASPDVWILWDFQVQTLVRWDHSGRKVCRQCGWRIFFLPRQINHETLHPPKAPCRRSTSAQNLKSTRNLTFTLNITAVLNSTSTQNSMPDKSRWSHQNLNPTGLLTRRPHKTLYLQKNSMIIQNPTFTLNSTARRNKLFPSCLFPLFQNKSWYTTFYMEMSLIFKTIINNNNNHFILLDI